MTYIKRTKECSAREKDFFVSVRRIGIDKSLNIRKGFKTSTRGIGENRQRRIEARA